MIAASAERFCVEQYAITRLLAVGDRLLDAGLQMAARNVHRAGDVPLLELLLLADVEDHGRVVRAAVGARVLEHLVDLRGIDLLDPGAGVLDQLLA